MSAAVTRSGPGRLLIAVYAVFAVAAIARAGWQLATDYAAAPLAYLLSALAAAIYVVATIGIAARGTAWHRVAAFACAVELAGVLVVGTASFVVPEYFPAATVWSRFGSGYGWVPLVLPALGLAWLWRTRGGAPVDVPNPRATADDPAVDERIRSVSEGSTR
ncbi:Integral membrane protein [Stackebrandtia soli]